MSNIQNQALKNHDILNCLANLSSDEVFTPPELANQMIDLLPTELFESIESTFLDPCCKSGVYLRELAKRLIHNENHQRQFERSLSFHLSEDEKHQKRLDHIFHKQLFGIAITELTALMSRRTLYCSKYPHKGYSISHFEDMLGNIFYHHTQPPWNNLDHQWDKNGKCQYCGASKSQYGQNERGENRETYAYPFIHTDKPQELFKNMKFDVIIGNPPYQMEDGGKCGSALPIYHLFIQGAMRLNPKYLTMIVPARWYSGGRGLDEFRMLMLKDERLTQLIDYPISNECFPGVQIKGGVCYFLWTRDKKDKCIITSIRNGNISVSKRALLENGINVFIRYNEAIGILAKTRGGLSFDGIVSSSKPFGLRTYIKGKDDASRCDDLVLYANKHIGYIPKIDVLEHKDWINKYKVFISSAYGAGDDFPHQIINKPFVGKPGSVCTETYLLIGPFNNELIANNVCSYMKTKFFRVLVLLIKNTQHAVKAVYQFVPLQDFSKPWTDEELYEKYGLTQDEIDFIESMIKPME